ncbi:MAG TPA: hypothetical protein VIK01_16485 [Polyangiaceae bacterium]
MKFVRGLAVVSWVSASLPLAIACGSAGSNGLFSASGGATSSNKAGESGVTAGTSSAGADTAGMSAGGTSQAGAGETSVAGKSSGGEHSGGSAGAGTGGKGQSGGGAGAAAGSGGASAGAGGAAAGAGGAAAGAGAGAGGSAAGSGGAAAGAGGGGGSAAGNGGTGGSGNGVGCPVNGPPTAGVACQVNTADSCFYSGVACSCEQLGASTFVRRWACYGTPDKCPDSAPAAGSGPCKSGAECPYPGGGFCACVGNGNEAKYACQPDAPVCPAKPFKGQACTNVKTCAYADDQCFCNGDSWSCESNN